MLDPEADRWMALRFNTERSVGFPSTGAPEWLVVRIEIDNRISLSEFKRQLDRFWPILRQRKMIRQTRPLSDMKIALVRHVCLETELSMTWSQRFAAWNVKQRRRKAWRLANVRAYVTEFRKAERSLTGVTYGLRWFYSEVARLDTAELEQLAKEGDRLALKEKKLRFAAGLDSLRDAGVNVPSH